MTKKKNSQKYIQDRAYQITATVFGLPLQLIVTLLTTIIMALGVYITIRLAPLYQDIAVIRAEADARDGRIETGFGHVTTELIEIKTAVYRLEDKLDKK